MKNVVILNRWDDEFADYHRFVDTTKFRLFCYTTNESFAYMEKSSDGYQLLESVDKVNFSFLQKKIENIIKCHGEIDYLISLSEYDMLEAAKLRDHFSISGINVQQAKVFTDKYIMKKSLKLSGIQYPIHKKVSSKKDILDFGDEHGYPVVLKPRNGAASKGVKILYRDQVNNLVGRRINEQVEQRIEGKILHADGLIRDGRIIAFKVSEYVNTCLEYLQGYPLGSVMISDKSQVKKHLRFTKKVLSALNHNHGAFHLEFFLSKKEPVFLEIGARVGGSEVPFLFNEGLDYDLIRQWFRIELGEDPDQILDPSTNGGWLIYPNSFDRKRVLKKVDHLPRVQTLFKSIIEKAGSTIEPSGDYYKNVGRFLLKGNQKEVLRDINSIINQMKVVYEE